VQIRPTPIWLSIVEISWSAMVALRKTLKLGEELGMPTSGPPR
jgi:hypothetical protein